MSSTSGSGRQYVGSHGPDDRGSHHESAFNPGQYPSNDAHLYPEMRPSSLDQQDQDAGYPQTHGKGPHAQRRPSITGPEDGTDRGHLTDHSRYSDRGQRVAGVGLVGNSRDGKGGYNGRSRPNEEARSRRGEGNGYKGFSLRTSIKNKISALGENYDDEPMPSNEHEVGIEAHIRDLQQQIHFLKQQDDVHTRTITDLRNDLKVETQNTKIIKESANKMAYAMESKDLYVGRQDSDDAVYSRFQTLIGQIKTWSIPFAQDRPSFHVESAAGAIADFRKVAPAVTDFSRFLQTPKNMRLFVRGYVGLVMAEMLFRTLPTGTHLGSEGEDIWMDRKLAHAVFRIENRLFHSDGKAVSSRELHDWRALTTTLISKLNDASSKTGKACVTDCSNRIMGVVGNWVATENRRTLEDSLLPVLLQAVKLSQTLRCQRAYWSVRHPGDAIRQGPQSELPDGLVFLDKATMDDKHGDEDSDEEAAHAQYSKTVEIFITPGLFKSGNSDGEQFDIETCIERSEVKCRPLSIGLGPSALNR